MEATTRVQGHLFVWHELDDVLKFQLKFGINMPDQPVFLSREDSDFRIKFMQEELDEFAANVFDKDMHGAADALIDLAYVLYGTVLMMGLASRWEAMWSEVQRANMAKERVKNASESKRGSSLDVIKPPGWTPPQYNFILGPGPWPTLEKQ